MNKPAILRRHLAILRLVQPPFLYPSKARILDRLLEEDLESISKRTFERDIREIHSYYGIKVTHCPRHRGYYLDQPADEDLSNFHQFMRLLERSERMAFLTQSSDALQSSKYLLLEKNQSQQDLQHLPVLWEALRTQRQLAFAYQTFVALEPKAYRADPIMLLEYRNRWYLAAWDGADEKFKTFGLERMQAPQLTQEPVQQDRRPAFLALKQDALGVHFGPDQEMTQVVLQVDATMAPYIKSVPIHHSQAVLEEDENGVIITFQIITNPELESAILSLGEHVEVLKPVGLRKKLKERAHRLAKLYDK